MLQKDKIYYFNYENFKVYLQQIIHIFDNSIQTTINLHIL